MTIATLRQQLGLQIPQVKLLEGHAPDFLAAAQTAPADLVIQHNLSRRHSLSAPDATFIALAYELRVPIITFESYFESVSPRAVVPA